MDNAPMQTQDVDINLSLKLSEMDFIFGLVTKQPYSEVAALVEKVRAQIIPQLPKPVDPANPPTE